MFFLYIYKKGRHLEWACFDLKEKTGSSSIKTMRTFASAIRGSTIMTKEMKRMEEKMEAIVSGTDVLLMRGGLRNDPFLFIATLSEINLKINPALLQSSESRTC